MSKVDPWFLEQIKEIVDIKNKIEKIDIKKIIKESILYTYDKEETKKAIKETCKDFSDIHSKPRIPFYVCVLDKLI